jgi:glycine betaine transporter
MERLRRWRNQLLGDVGTVFYLSLLLIAVFLAAAMVDPLAVQRQAQKILDATANNFGWLYLMTTSGFVLFALGLAFSRFGSIRLGPDDEPPEFSFKSWLAMIFSGGMGVGLVFWGVAEPMMHFNPWGSAHHEPQKRHRQVCAMLFSIGGCISGLILRWWGWPLPTCVSGTTATG